ncbi:PAN domain-containing protein [Rhizobium leguminosarum]|uniref:PAN domain-containing protein n=1 Tax=Rhizobium leguminosarum TaxID=384 RepID=UPI003F99639E
MMRDLKNWLRERRAKIAGPLTALYGMLAAVVLVGSAVGQDSGRRFNEYPDTALKGFITAELPKTDIGACRRICQERSGCAGFDHRQQNKACRLFGSVAAAASGAGSFAATRERVPGYRLPSNAVEEATQVGPTQSTWTHNGSVMSLQVTRSADGGSKVKIVYDLPKSELASVGIQHGTTLFEGRLDGSNLTGKARLTGRCGIIQYDVRGLYDARSLASFYLRGPSPKRGNDCTIQSWDSAGPNANLRFDPS